MATQRFSVAAVLLSYFLVAGGLVLALILLARSDLGGDGAFYSALAVGAAVGGAFAARASRGRTILEPAIGGGLVILTTVAIFIGTDAGTFFWHVGKDEIVRLVAIAGACAAAGSIIGAIVAERLPGGQSRSPAVWLLHVAFTTLGSAFIASIVSVGVVIHGAASSKAGGAGLVFGALAAGALLTGLVVGVSAPRRLLLVTFLGATLGMIGYFALYTLLPVFKADEKRDFWIGLVVLSIGYGIIAFIGNAIGWRLGGRRAAQDAEATARTFG